VTGNACTEVVTPAKAGVQNQERRRLWIPDSLAPLGFGDDHRGPPLLRAVPLG
jgi:hypothetical protein